MRSDFRFVYMVSGNGAVFAQVLAATASGLLPGSVKGVIADRPCRAAAIAEEQRIPTRIIDPAFTPDRRIFDRAVAEALDAFGPDGIVLNFNRLLGPDITAAHAGRIVNLHYALLPAFPGLGGSARAVEAGVRVAGVTTHLVDDTVDAGPIVGQAVTPLSPTASAADAGRQLFLLACPLLVQTMRFLAEGCIAVRPSGGAVVTRGDYARLPFVPALDPDIAAYAERLARDDARQTAASSSRPWQGSLSP